MWCTSGGNTGSFFRAALIVPPEATDVRTLSIARSTTVLPDVLPVTLIASSIGTPAVTSDESVRDQRARATFCTISPIFIGVRRRSWSHWRRPVSERFHLRKPKTTAATTPTRTYG